MKFVMEKLNEAWAAMSPGLRRATLVLLLALASVFVATVTILSWNDGSLPSKLGLVATKQDLQDQTTALAAVDTVKAEAIAQRVAEAMRQSIMDELGEREAEARRNILAPMLQEIKDTRRDVATINTAQQASGRQMRELPSQMSRQLEEILEASKPPLSTEDMLREVMRNQARQDSLLNSISDSKRKRTTKAPTM